MQKLEEHFFDEYKRLDNLCRDLLAAPRGVSEYIEQMEESAADGERLVPGWRDDYYALKHLRWLRNQIAHEAGASGCSAGELAQLQRFHARVLKQQDPLALLRRARPKPAAAPRRPAAPGRRAVRPARRTPLRVYLCAAAVALLLALLAVYLLTSGPAAV